MICSGPHHKTFTFLRHPTLPLSFLPKSVLPSCQECGISDTSTELVGLRRSRFAGLEGREETHVECPELIRRIGLGASHRFSLGHPSSERRCSVDPWLVRFPVDQLGAHVRHLCRKEPLWDLRHTQLWRCEVLRACGAEANHPENTKL